MSLYRLALRNTRRQKRRTFLTILGICLAVIAVTFMDAYIRGIKENFLETFIRFEAGHLKIIPKKFQNSTRPIPLDNAITNVVEIENILGDNPEITSFTPRIRFPVLLDKNTESIPALGIGLIPSREENFMRLSEFLISGSLPHDSSHEILLSKQLAQELGKKIGDELFMVTHDAYGGLGPGLFQVSGIIETGIGIFDKNVFYAPLAAVQEMLALENSALEIICRVNNGFEKSDQLAININQQITGAGFENLLTVPWRKQGTMVGMTSMMGLAHLVMMILVGAISITIIINTTLMSIMERTREIGTLRALGFSRKYITRMITIESLIIGITGTISGIILGMLISLLIQKTGIDLSNALKTMDMPMEMIIHPHPALITAVKSAIFGLVLSVFAAWYPSRVAVRLKPARALRTY